MATIKKEQIVAMNQHYRRFSLDYFLNCQREVGFTNVEFWLGGSHFFVDSNGYEDPLPVLKKFKEYGLNIVSVTIPSMAYQYQYSSQNKEILEESFKYFRNGIELASIFGADRVVVNSGWGYNGEDEDSMWNRTRDILYRLAEIGKKYGITLVMESLRRDETNIVYNLERSKKMFDEINHPNFKMMVDSIATGAYGETLEDWFKTFNENLIHMHFLDGDPYVHNIWGDGNTPLNEQFEIMNKYNFKGYLVQEVADERYFQNPFEADIKNMRVLERFFENK